MDLHDFDREEVYAADGQIILVHCGRCGQALEHRYHPHPVTYLAGSLDRCMCGWPDDHEVHDPDLKTPAPFDAKVATADELEAWRQA